MKKLIQILFVILIISNSVLSHAAGNKNKEKTGQNAHQDVGPVRGSSMIAHTDVGGEIVLVITVIDLTNHPIQGATVSAPCTGQASKLTDVHGVATFSMGNVCTCAEDLCTVTTTKGCYQQFRVSCGKYTVNCNQ